MRITRLNISFKKNRLARDFCNYLIAGALFLPLATPAQADTCPEANCIYYQGFNQFSPGQIDQTSFKNNTGWQVDTTQNGTVTFTTGRSGSAVIIDSNSAPYGIKINATDLFGSVQPPAQGTISFWFKPIKSVSTSDNDWGSQWICHS